MHQQSNETAEPVARYIKGTPENRAFLICRIFVLLTICYFSKLLNILMALKCKKKKSTFVLYYHCPSQKYKNS
jgi:hypothetical protein